MNDRLLKRSPSGDDLAKRLLDVCVAATVLVLFAPVWLIIAVMVRLTSPGPALFRMRHVVGKDARRFTMYKFRTMKENNDPSLHKDAFARFARGEPIGVVRRAGEDFPIYKVMDDPRVTSFGRALRRTGLDEVPQLLNVLRGEMSLVGPRPSQEYEYEFYRPDQRRRFAVLPGITGLHQVSARSAVPFEEMVRLDLEYVDTRSVWLDIGIMWKTVSVMAKGKGAY